MIVTYVGLFDWVDLERGKTGANISWGDPFLAGDCGTGVRGMWVPGGGEGKARKGIEREQKSD